MDTLTAYCGLVCSTCPIYVATQERDKKKQAEMRGRIAGICNEKYGTRYGPEDITDCDGCRGSTGRLFRGSENCAIRPCARRRKLESCACCPDYVCETLGRFLAAEPEAGRALEEIRRSR